QGQNRSRTGAELYAAKGFETGYAGIYSDSRPLTRDLLAWADKIVVFEDEHVKFIQAKWPDLAWETPIFNLEIRDIYNYGEGGLGKVIEQRLDAIL
ncbi:MAG: hypothetical protein R6W91_02440, partial [Thermoplasmata archaeon]